MVKRKPEPDKTYNGWTNYETWAVNLWMDNDPGSQQHFMDMAREVKESTGDKTPNPYMNAHDNARAVLADRLKDYHDEMAEQWMADQSSVFADLLNAALSEVNWREIAEHLLTNFNRPPHLTHEYTRTTNRRGEAEMKYTVIEISSGKVVNSSQALPSLKDALEVAHYAKNKYGHICSIENSDGVIVEVVK